MAKQISIQQEEQEERQALADLCADFPLFTLISTTEPGSFAASDCVFYSGTPEHGSTRNGEIKLRYGLPYPDVYLEAKKYPKLMALDDPTFIAIDVTNQIAYVWDLTRVKPCRTTISNTPKLNSDPDGPREDEAVVCFAKSDADHIIDMTTLMLSDQHHIDYFCYEQVSYVDRMYIIAEGCRNADDVINSLRRHLIRSNHIKTHTIEQVKRYQDLLMEAAFDAIHFLLELSDCGEHHDQIKSVYDSHTSHMPR